MKKTICLLLAAILVMFTFSACNPSDGPSDDPSHDVLEVYEGAPDLRGKTITIMTENTWVSGIDFSDILPRFRQIEARTGCHIVWETVPGGTDYSTVVQTRLADPNNCPDIIMMSTDLPALSKYIEDDLLYDLTKAYDCCPNIKQFYEVYRTDLKGIFTYLDGGIYNVVGDTWRNDDEQTAWYGEEGDNALWYRSDIATDLGWETYPKTMDELHQLLKSVKENYPDMIPMHMWNWSCWESVRVFTSAYGLHYNNEECESYFYPDENGVVQYEPALAATKEWLTEMNQWYKEGLVIVGASEDAKIGAAAQGKVFSGFYAGVYQTVEPTLKQSDPDASFRYMPMPGKAGYPTTYMPRADYSNSFFIVDNGDEDRCRAAAQFLDYAFFSDYGVYSEVAGVEGEGWSLDESGSFIPNEDFIASILKGELVLESTGAHVHFCGPSINTLAASKTWDDAMEKVRSELGLAALMTPEQEANWKEISAINSGNYCAAFPKMYMSDEDVHKLNTLGSDIGTFTAEMLERYIIGTKKLENFETEFVDKLYEMGLQEILDIYQRYYNAYLENAVG